MPSLKGIRRYLYTTACWITLLCGEIMADPREPGESGTSEAQYRQVGAYAVEMSPGSMPGKYRCEVHYEEYGSDADAATAVVVLTHGFMRQLKHMRGWAQHWSSWGLPTTIVSLCNSTLINGHHQRNAEDLAHLAKRLYPGQPIIFAGFSAGGLAAWRAANDAPAAVAYLGLDPVDSGKLAQRASNRRPLPGLILYARASMCNARNNFLRSARQQPGFALVAITGASHCHFELPFDRRCTWVCGGPSAERSNEEIQRELLGITTQWLLNSPAR